MNGMWVHWREYLSEFVGTFLLIFVGLSAVVVNFSAASPMVDLIPHPGARLFLAAAIFAGTGSLFAVSPLGQRSGAHINPSISIGFWLLGRMSLPDVVGYVSAQLAGAILGALALAPAWGEWARAVRFGATVLSEGVSAPEGLLTEVLITFLLVMTILVFLSKERAARWTPLAVWVIVIVVVYFAAPLTGAGLNPARSLGPALAASVWTDHWLYWVGPIVGAGLATGVFRLPAVAKRHRLLCCKLFHPKQVASCSFKGCAYMRPRSGAPGQRAI